MVRSYWIGPVVVALAVTGLAWSQMAPPAPTVAGKERTLTLQEAGQPGLKCKLLKTWRQADGHKAYLVQALTTGEFITVAETTDASAGAKAVATKIYHWGENQSAPSGTPEVPNNAIILGEPFVKTVATPVPTPVMRNDLPAAAPVTSSGKQWPSAHTTQPVDVKPHESKPLVLPPGPITPPALTTTPKAPESKPTVVAAPALPPLTSPPATVIQKAPESKPILPPAVVVAPETKTVPPIVIDKAPATPGMVPAIKTVPMATSTNPGAPAPITAKAIEKPLPSDWQASWGRVDAQKNPSAPSLAPPAPGVTITKVPTTAGPHQADPYTNPNRYSTTPPVVTNGPSLSTSVVITPQGPVATEAKPIVPVVSKSDDAMANKPSLQTAMNKVETPAVTPNTASPIRVVETKPASLPMMKSVAAAIETPPAPTNVQMPAEANAFSTPVAPEKQGVAPAQPQVGMPPSMMPGGRPPLVYQPPMDRGIPPAAGNAFTHTSTARPIPANFGPPAQVPNAFADGNTSSAVIAYAPAAAMPSPMDRGPAPMKNVTITGPMPGGPGSPTQLMAILRDSLYPSQREAAAESLATRDWRAQPQIVDALVKGAKDDPAPMVRAECARSLGKMGVSTAPVVAACQALKSDADPRVRREAEQALLALMGGSAAKDNMVRPASMTTPK